MPILIIGNKGDELDPRVLSTDEIHDAIKSFECKYISIFDVCEFERNKFFNKLELTNYITRYHTGIVEDETKTKETKVKKLLKNLTTTQSNSKNVLT